MNNAYKRETIVGFTCWDINSKWVHSRNRHKDAKREIRRARRKAKQILQKEVAKDE